MKRGLKPGKIIVAFGAGLLISCVCPTEWLVTILAILLVVMGTVTLFC